jgi:hypothetical protein
MWVHLAFKQAFISTVAPWTDIFHMIIDRVTFRWSAQHMNGDFHVSLLLFDLLSCCCEILGPALLLAPGGILILIRCWFSVMMRSGTGAFQCSGYRQ